MNQLKISTRLVVLLGCMSALLIAIGAIGLRGISQANDALLNAFEHRTTPMGQIAESTKSNAASVCGAWTGSSHPVRRGTGPGSLVGAPPPGPARTGLPDGAQHRQEVSVLRDREGAAAARVDGAVEQRNFYIAGSNNHRVHKVTVP